MDEGIQNTPLLSRVIRYASTENLIYWLTGLVWIPWYFSETLGMIGMLILTPLYIFLGTLYSLSVIPQNVWRKEIFVIILTFVGTCVFIDLVFWVMWRGHDIVEWFLPITRVGTGNFIGYVEMIVISYISMELALRSSRVMKIQEKLSFSLRTTIIFGVFLFLFSLISAILFW